MTVISSLAPRVALFGLVVLSGGVSTLACGSSDSASPGSTGAAGNGGTVGASLGGGLPGAAGHAGESGASSAGASGAGAAGGGAVGGIAGAGAGAGAGHGGASGAGSGGSGGAGGAASAFLKWPGKNAVVTVDDEDVFGENLSGLFYEPALGAAPAVLWAVQNGPSKLYRLLWNGTHWSPDATNKWATGHTLTYPSGSGGPDSEGVTKTAFGDPSVYVSTERNNDDNGKSLLEVLLFDDTATTATISATRAWNLTADLPTVDPNLGLEAIAWVPDAFLTSNGFVDESTHAAYDPSHYADHAGGIFFVGLEANGMIYGYALNHTDSSFTRVATIESGNPAIMDLSFDRDVGYLWAACDDTCNGRTNVLTIDTHAGSPTLGKFTVRQGFERPTSVANINDEGFTVTPESTCVGGFKDVLYSDDSNTDNHAIRRDSIPCGPFLN